MKKQPSLTRYAWLSIGAAFLTMGIKAGGYLVTQSVGLLSDALESGVNLAAAFTALAALHIGSQPPDEDHAYGHQKVEYLSSGAEGGLISLAAIAIIITAAQRLLDLQPVEHLGIGLLLSSMASIVNLIVALILLRVGRRERSIALEADGQHLLSDVWTSAGVLAGVGLVWITGWQILDPIVALIVAALLARTGFMLLRRSAYGLIDTALPEEDLQKIQQVLDQYEDMGVHHHALRTRQAGSRSFVSLHVQVPGRWSVQKGHDLLEGIESDLRHALPTATIFTHIEPIEDPRSFRDAELDRGSSAEG
ncbi:MAG: cation diffusion facilitator family transporter [Anaerolineales bacterium]|jgi:cation diffusion facilitator family transporter